MEWHPGYRIHDPEAQADKRGDRRNDCKVSKKIHSAYLDIRYQSFEIGVCVAADCEPVGLSAVITVQNPVPIRSGK